MVVASALVVTSVPTILARPGLAQAILAQPGGCASPPYSEYCTVNAANPCTNIAVQCIDYVRFFVNLLQCTNVPGMVVASANNGMTNGNTWTDCMGNSLPGYNCTKSELDCGTMSTYWGAHCEAATACGQVTMEACIGDTPYDCP